MRTFMGIKSLILMAGIQWFAVLSLCFVPSQNANAGTCVSVPSLGVLATRPNAGHVSERILKMLRRQGPRDEFPRSVKAFYLGSAEFRAKKFHVVYTVWVWDHGVRETDRLIFFSEDWRYIGNYGEVYDPPKRICGNTLFWPYSPKIGNKISLGNNGPPNNIVLDGETYEFEAGRN